MQSSEVESWLRSKRRIAVDSVELRPKPHPLLPGTPLSITRGQAAALHAIASDQSVWIIKKFHPGKAPDLVYSTAIRTLLPPLPAFVSGKNRRLISAADVKGTYRPGPLVNWLDGTILMPRIEGVDWASLADGLRDGDLTLPIEPRALLCRGLAEAVVELEAANCSHRDLSSGNVFIDQQSWAISLIDWDSIYHPSLIMPPNTTGGTEGYIAPFVVWVDGMVTASSTWQPYGDRFALAILCAEFLTMDEDSALTGDGGMFNQRELRARQGTTIAAARRVLTNVAPDAIDLFERALTAEAFDDCPAPEEWMQLADSLLGVVSIQVPPIATDWFDEARFWVTQVDREVAPPVIVLPDDWTVSTVPPPQPPPQLDPAIVPFESWGINAQAVSSPQAARILSPDDWVEETSESPGQGTFDEEIASFESWGSSKPVVNPADGKSSTGSGA